MVNTLLGVKKNMTAAYDARGRRVGVTVVEIKPNWVTQVKSSEGKDGYSALQLGTGTKKSVRKPQLGLYKKAGIEEKVRWLKEVKGEAGEAGEVKAGATVAIEEVFAVGDMVKISGVTKGRGFQGGVRRHGFHGGPKTHGQSDRHRAPGSIGSGTTPGRVLKGKRMAGHMGNVTVSTRGLEVVAVDKKNNLMIIKGAVPGASGNLVTVTKLGRVKGYIPPPEEKEDEEEESAQAQSSVDNQTQQPEESAQPVGESNEPTENPAEVKEEENA